MTPEKGGPETSEEDRYRNMQMSASGNSAVCDTDLALQEDEVDSAESSSKRRRVSSSDNEEPVVTATPAAATSEHEQPAPAQPPPVSPRVSSLVLQNSTQRKFPCPMIQ